tara:strand:- start:814 stop:987 length:174 start_codon:yes stop_codon:yes gene_type:complete
MYGDDLIYIENVELWKGQLRLTVFDSTEECTMYVFMSYKEAWKLGTDILNQVFRHKK